MAFYDSSSNGLTCPSPEKSVLFKEGNLSPLVQVESMRSVILETCILFLHEMMKRQEDKSEDPSENVYF